MNTKMYVVNLPFKATAQEITDLFSQYGAVTDVFLPVDRDTGRPRGFAFVSMDTPEAMNAAIEGLNGKDFGGRNLAINEARPREERPGGFGGGPRGGGRGGYGGGGGGGGGGRGGYGGAGGAGKRWERDDRRRGGFEEGGDRWQ